MLYLSSPDCLRWMNAKFKRLFGRQIFGRVYRFALTAHFKMQLDAIGIRVAHLGNLLALFNSLVFFD